MLKRVRSVMLFVADVRQSREWYEKVLGYLPDQEMEHFAMFKVGAVDFCLLRADDKSPVSTGGEVAYWEVDDFDAAVQHFLAHGAKLHRGPAQEEGLRFCQILDPFGSVIGLECRR
jgi:predicted enzyme related to lactoylglutathione lyase